MKMFAIGDPKAVLGFSLVGVEGEAAASAAEVNQALDKALSAKDIGIILITQDAAKMIGPRMEQLSLRSIVPLVVEIPSSAGVDSSQPSLSDVVLRAIGVKI